MVRFVFLMVIVGMASSAHAATDSVFGPVPTLSEYFPRSSDNSNLGTRPLSSFGTTRSSDYLPDDWRVPKPSEYLPIDWLVPTPDDYIGRYERPTRTQWSGTFKRLGSLGNGNRSSSSGTRNFTFKKFGSLGGGD